MTLAYAHEAQQRQILEILYAQGIFDRPYFVADGVPLDRVQILRRAFMQTLDDPGLLDEAAKTNLLVVPTSGDVVQSLLQKIYASPPTLLRSVEDAIKPK